MNAEHFFAAPIRLAWNIDNSDDRTPVAFLVSLEHLSHSGREPPAFLDTKLSMPCPGKAVVRIRDDRKDPNTLLLEHRICNQNRGRSIWRCRSTADEGVKPGGPPAWRGGCRLGGLRHAFIPFLSSAHTACRVTWLGRAGLASRQRYARK